MTISAILDTKGKAVVSIAVGARVSDALALLAGRRIGAVPVMDGDRVAGIFSERDVIEGLQRDGAAILDKRVDDVMTSPVITVTGEVSVLSALAMMTQQRVRHLPVVEQGRLIGIVSIGDLVKMRIDRIEQEARAMRDYIQSA
ncbi:CBS domain-containing protein [Flavisphingomonas formosensis]|uniref:CBS domain-containing protein n=1 Tax=Flavisphingomonas formosensis TaxID=861534 RepID=UPI0012F8E778|nr:CBS domain-containing protein [Sphingomonas formosensis]